MTPRGFAQFVQQDASRTPTEVLTQAQVAELGEIRVSRADSLK